MSATREELLAEIAYLRGELGLSIEATEIHRVREALKLSPQEARLVLVLRKARGRVMTVAQVSDALPQIITEDRSCGAVKSVVRHIRDKLGDGLIGTATGGYYLTAGGIDRVDSALGVLAL